MKVGFYGYPLSFSLYFVELNEACSTPPSPHPQKEKKNKKLLLLQPRLGESLLHHLTSNQLLDKMKQMKNRPVSDGKPNIKFFYYFTVMNNDRLPASHLLCLFTMVIEVVV